MLQQNFPLIPQTMPITLPKVIMSIPKTVDTAAGATSNVKMAFKSLNQVLFVSPPLKLIH